MRDFDLSTRAGCDEAQADLERLKSQIELCVTRDLLPWGLGIGRRQMLIDKARVSLSRLDDAYSPYEWADGDGPTDVIRTDAK